MGASMKDIRAKSRQSKAESDKTLSPEQAAQLEADRIANEAKTRSALTEHSEASASVAVTNKLEKTELEKMLKRLHVTAFEIKRVTLEIAGSEVSAAQISAAQAKLYDMMAAGYFLSLDGVDTGREKHGLFTVNIDKIAELVQALPAKVSSASGSDDLFIVTKVTTTSYRSNVVRAGVNKLAQATINEDGEGAVTLESGVNVSIHTVDQAYFGRVSKDGGDRNMVFAHVRYADATTEILVNAYVKGICNMITAKTRSKVISADAFTTLSDYDKRSNASALPVTNDDDDDDESNDDQ